MKNKRRKIYVVVGYKSWNKDIFNEKISKYPGKWYFVSERKELTDKKLKKINPEYIFFLHWSWKVPEEIINNYECVCFHMTDVPYGRGGSPLQNLITRGHRRTKLTALRMVEDFDAGPVYLKEELSLEGRAEEIYIRASYLAADMILKIIKNNPESKPQKGKPVIFKRRKPKESRIPKCKDLQGLFDFIRMLDAEGYPRAFIEYNGFLFEFSQPALYQDGILCNVKIKRIKKDEK